MVKYFSKAIGAFLVALATQNLQTASTPSSEKNPSVILEGRVTDELGRPLAGVKIMLMGGVATRWEAGSAVTNDDGIYRFDPVPNGYFQQVESVDGTRTWRNCFGMRISHQDYVAEDKQDWWDFQIPFEPGTYYRDLRLTPGGRLRGSIMSGDGTMPAAGLDLRVMGIMDLNGCASYATTDSEGRFCIDRSLHAGEYEIQVNDPKENYAVLSCVRITVGEVASVDIAYK
ncbi:MAG: carboxypeptidase regulatory-like domain-containing protein [Phycisphaerales bacterium]|nr:carboxypeptidase regulatory-like domain-containing protein [Phycisphaerales bacterium]MCB9864587.1 carboxypeptidase regulatory-like domain-containing protein [Phycisphaerales bacterium]